MTYVLTSEQMRELDRTTIVDYGITGFSLMRRAGKGAAQIIQNRYPAHKHILILCGKGNNGGDGYVLGHDLHLGGRNLTLVSLCPLEALTGDVKRAYEQWRSLGLQTNVLGAQDVADLIQRLPANTIIIDAMLGTGLQASPRSPYKEVILATNASPCQTIALDIPSGVCGTSGNVFDNIAIRANGTITFAYPKRGNLLFPGAELSGEIDVIDIGIPDELPQKHKVQLRQIGAPEGPIGLPARPRNCHKGHFGHVGVWAGSQSSPGAAILAVEGALRAGAGLVSWAATEALFASGPSWPKEAMLRWLDKSKNDEEWQDILVRDTTTLVVGPGLQFSDRSRRRFKTLLTEYDGTMVLDAEALNIIASDNLEMGSARGHRIITPHPKEMSRLLGATTSEVLGAPVEAAEKIARDHKIYVVLKGAHTIVAQPQGDTFIATVGNPGLAKAGSGDVLTGMIAALIGQCPQTMDGILSGILLHGEAAQRASQTHGFAGMRARDVLEAAGDVFLEWQR